MSQITLASNAAGTAIFTVASPATSTNRALTLPDVDGTLAAIVTGTTVASTSGTTIDFAGLPSGIKRITVMLNGVSLSGTDSLLVQIGNSGGFVTTGYVSTCQSGSAGNGSSTAGFLARSTGASDIVSGIMTIVNMTGGAWVYNWLGKLDTGNVTFGGGNGAITGTLDRIRITTTGTNNFDAGTVNIMYEG